MQKQPQINNNKMIGKDNQLKLNSNSHSKSKSKSKLKLKYLSTSSSYEMENEMINNYYNIWYYWRYYKYYVNIGFIFQGLVQSLFFLIIKLMFIIYYQKYYPNHELSILLAVSIIVNIISFLYKISIFYIQNWIYHFEVYKFLCIIIDFVYFMLIVLLLFIPISNNTHNDNYCIILCQYFHNIYFKDIHLNVMHLSLIGYFVVL